MLDYSTLTNKQGLIVWGGENSTNYGMVVSEPPAFDKPVRKQTVYKVPGRNGAIVFQEDAWEDVTRSYKVFVAEDTQYDSGGQAVSGTLAEKVADIAEWLYSKKGYTRLEDNFEPDYYRLAYYSGGDSFTDELIQVGEATLKFTCRPERFLKSGETAVTVTNGDTMTNPTKYASKPLIYIVGSGDVSVSISGVTINASVDDYIYIDCETMNAYRLASENKNSDISGAFPVLKSGVNAIATTGTITTLKITPRYFKL